MSQSQFPNYKDYDEDFERYLNILKPGSIAENISMEDAIQYVKANKITDGLINFTLQYIMSQIKQTINAQTYYIQSIQELQPILSRLPNYAIIILQQTSKFNGILWDTLQKRLILINKNFQIETLLEDQEIIKIDVFFQDILSPIAGIFIRAINYENMKLNFTQCLNQPLMKWVLLKYYRLKQLKEQGESYSRILDNQLLEEVNKTNSKPQSRIPSNKSNIFQQQQSKSHISQEPLSLKSLNQVSQSRLSPNITNLSLKSASKIDNLKDQITSREVTQLLDNIKQEILYNQADEELKPKDYLLKPVVPYFRPNQMINLPIDQLEKILQEQVKHVKPAEPNPQEKLQELLMYYYQHNPQQYKILLGEYSELIHEQMFKNMGLPSSTKVQLENPSFLNQTTKNNVSKSHDFSVPQFSSQLFKPKLDVQQPIQEEIVAKKYNRKITKLEVENIKQKLILTPNVMEFYFSYLNEEFRRVLIMPLEFYNVLSQTNYDKASNFTNLYQGKNRTIFDLFDKLFVPIQISQYEFVGIYVDFHQKTMYMINTLERKDRKQPPYKEILDIPTMHFVQKFIENEYNHKVMRAFNILNWQFVEMRNEYAQNFNHSAIVLAFIIDQICNHKPIIGDNQQLKEFAQKILNVIRKAGIQK